MDRWIGRTKPGRSLAMPRVGQVHDHLSMSDGFLLPFSERVR